MPFRGSHSQSTGTIAVRYGSQSFLRISGDQRQHHQGQGKRTGEQRVTESQSLSEEDHTEQTENDRRNTGQGLGGKFNEGDQLAGLGIFVQVNSASHTNGGCDQQSDHDDVQSI